MLASAMLGQATSPTTFDEVRRQAVALVDAGHPLSVLEKLVAGNPPLRRFARYLWVERERGEARTFWAIAKSVGMSRDTITAWGQEPGRCLCGGVRHLRASVCDVCARQARRYSAAALLDARDRFLAIHGHLPASSDWARDRRPDVAAGWPSSRSVTRYFDSWEAFVTHPSPADTLPGYPSAR
jgi:hypothetical protein